MNTNRIAIPSLVRIKSDAIARVGIYLSRANYKRVAVFQSSGLGSNLTERLREGLQAEAIEAVVWNEITENDFEQAIAHFTKLPRNLTAVVGFGGGKALD